MSNKYYVPEDFQKELGLSNRSFGQYKKGGGIPTKIGYTEDDLVAANEFLKTKEKPKKKAGKKPRLKRGSYNKTSSNDIYTREEFAKKIGTTFENLTKNIFYRGVVPRKEMFSDKDVEKYLNRQQKGKKKSEGKKTSNKGEYTSKEFAAKLGINKINLMNLKQRGHLPKKKTFNEQDFINFQKRVADGKFKAKKPIKFNKSVKGSDKMTKHHASTKLMKSDSESSPFKIETGLYNGVTRDRGNVIKKLANDLLQLDITKKGEIGPFVCVPLKFHTSKSRVSGMVKNAKKLIIADNPKLKDIYFSTTPFKDGSGKILYVQVFRIN